MEGEKFVKCNQTWTKTQYTGISMRIVSKNKQRAKLKTINNLLNAGKNILIWIKTYLYFA